MAEYILRDFERGLLRWSGFVSVTGDTPQRLATIGYDVNHNPFTEYKTVKECLRFADETTKEKEQDCLSHNI